MISFESDYIAGAHPEVLRKLAETNLEALPGYGSDPYCESARQKIRAAVGKPITVVGNSGDAFIRALRETEENP